MVEGETVDSHINWMEEGGVLEEHYSVIGMRVHDGRARKIENNEPGRSWLNMQRNKKLPQNGRTLSTNHLQDRRHD